LQIADILGMGRGCKTEVVVEFQRGASKEGFCDCIFSWRGMFVTICTRGLWYSAIYSMTHNHSIFQNFLPHCVNHAPSAMNTCFTHLPELPKLDKNRIVEQQKQKTLVFDGKCKYDVKLGADFLSKAGIGTKYITNIIEQFKNELPMCNP